MEPARTFEQLELLLIDPIQYDYEVIRPVLFADQTIAERSRQTAIDRDSISEKARRFVQEGMLGLVDQRATKAGRKSHVFPPPVARCLIHIKHAYPPIHYRELVRIVERKFGYKTNHHTVKRFLDDHPIPEQLTLDIQGFHDFEQAYQARWLVVRLAYEGWNDHSIAGYLKLSRQHVIRLQEQFARDGFAGLEDHRTRTIAHPTSQLTIPLLKEVLDLQQEYPRAGRFRLHGILTQRHGDTAPSERTVGRAMAQNRQFHGAPGPWPAPPPPATTHPPVALPYQPTYPHHYWFLDIRYLVKLDGQWVYSLCIIEGYSRKIVGSLVSAYQDELAILQVLHAAVNEYGAPAGIVSDNGAVFTGALYRTFLHALEITPCYIAKGEPWQNLIEAQFKIQLRLADVKFHGATTLRAIQHLHQQFVETFNTTPHWAHRERTDGRATPTKVLDWIRGRPVDMELLRRVVRGLPFERVVNAHGFIRIQHFCLYAEPGLARQRVTVWILDTDLQIAHDDTVVARYDCRFDRDLKRVLRVKNPTVYRTAFRSPQLELFELDDAYWGRILHRPPYASTRPHQRGTATQLPLHGLEAVVALLTWWITG